MFDAQVQNVQAVNPLFSSCKVYILYEGLNRNNSSISRSVAESMIKTLYNVPIVGEFSEEIDDFRGHGGKIELTNNVIKYIHTTKPFGLIPESSEVSWEEVTERDGSTREYLTCTGYLWTGRYPEATKVITEGAGQSMEIADVQGQWVKADSKNSYFQVDSAVFSALTILGKDVDPCFESANIVSYQLDKDKFSTEFSLMIKELKNSLDCEEYVGEEDKNMQHNAIEVAEDFNNEGGEKVDEKLELFTKYSNLNEEDIAELKANIENYSIEELEIKLNELVEFKQTEELAEPELVEDNVPTDYSLTAQQMEQEIRKALADEKGVDRWGDNVRSYWYIDHDETRVYAEDVQNSYTPVGLDYSINGDFVTIDFSTKKRIKFVPQDMEGDSDVVASFVSLERNEFETEKNNVEFTVKIEAGVTELDNLQTEFATIKEMNLDLQNQINTFSQTDVAQLTLELEGLRTFKLEKEKVEKLSVIDKFSQLNEEDILPFVEQLDKFSVEDLELQLFALIGKKGLQFTSSTTKNTNLIFALNDIKSTDSNVPAWAEFVEQYKSKQK